MVDFLIYTGVAIIIAGCILCFYGAFKYMKVRNTGVSADEKASARLTFRHYRLAWMIMGLVGCLMVCMAAFVG